MNKFFLQAAALIGAIAVALGAFAAHGLKKIVAIEAVSTFQTGVQYQIYHALALLATAIIYEKYANKWIKCAGIFFITGIILFSGSLYVLTLIKATYAVGAIGIGIVTPIGGLFFIVAWLLLFVGIYKTTN